MGRMSRHAGKKRTNKGGKLVDTWYYAYKGIPQPIEAEELPDEDAEPSNMEVGWIKTEVCVYIVKETKDIGTPPHETNKVEFRVECENPAFEFSGPDIAALHAASWDKLDHHFEIKWSRWFLVKVSRDSIYEGLGTAMSFTYDSVEKGITHDGKELLRQDRWGRRERITPWPGRFVDNQGRVQACIEATDENEKALEEFGKRIDALRERLADFLRPDVIEQNLRLLSGLKFLPEVPKGLPEHAEGCTISPCTCALPT